MREACSLVWLALVGLFRSRASGVFFAFQSWVACITNIFGFDLRQAQAREGHRQRDARRSFQFLGIETISYQLFRSIVEVSDNRGSDVCPVECRGHFGRGCTGVGRG